jgi:hypothetical protein
MSRSPLASRAVSIPLAIVPPDSPPRCSPYSAVTLRAGRPNRAMNACCAAQVPRSEGIESNPQVWTIRAPVARACAWWASIIRRIHCTSPVRSQ